MGEEEEKKMKKTIFCQEQQNPGTAHAIKDTIHVPRGQGMEHGM